MRTADWFCSPGWGEGAAGVSPTASNNASSASSSGQLPVAREGRRVGKEPPAEVPGLAPRQLSCSTAQAGGIHTVPPQGWEFRQEKQVYK